MVSLPTPDVVYEVLAAPDRYENDEQRELCRNLVQELLEEELEYAARTCYCYWLVSTNAVPWSSIAPGASTGPKTLEEARIQSAMQEARRHFMTLGNDPEKVLVSVREAAIHRKEKHTDLLRIAGSLPTSSFDLSDEEMEIVAQYRVSLTSELNKQKLFVRGYATIPSKSDDTAAEDDTVDDARPADENLPPTSQKLALALKYTRTTKNAVPEEYGLAQNFLAEKAMACTELLSKGQAEQIVCVFDFTNYESRHVPPYSLAYEYIKVGQKIYPHRLHKMIILNPPFFVRGLYAMIYPILTTAMAEKLIMIKGEAEIKAYMAGIMAEDQVNAVFTEEGGLRKEDVDVERLLNETSFHELYE